MLELREHLSPERFQSLLVRVFVAVGVFQGDPEWNRRDG